MYLLLVLCRRLSPLPHYYIPKDGPLNTYREYIRLLPAVDHPEAFGQHTNADIIAQIQETRKMFETLLVLAPQMSAPGGAGAGAGAHKQQEGAQQAAQQVARVETRESKVLELADSIKKQLPADIDFETTAQLMASEMNPLNVVLLQEVFGPFSAPSSICSRFLALFFFLFMHSFVCTCPCIDFE